MYNCLLCQMPLTNSLTIRELFSFQRQQAPVVCSKCLGTFIRIKKEESCLGCSRSQKDQEYCPDCLKWQKWYPELKIEHTAFFEYEESFKNWLHRYKFQGDIRLSQIFISEIQQVFRQNRDACIVPLPISLTSKEERGFNQCEEILRAAKVPFVHLLENIHTGEKQSEKDRQERLHTRQPFQIQPIRLSLDQKIILFDDVYTTGRTIVHAKQLLASFGYKDVISFTLGR